MFSSDLKIMVVDDTKVMRVLAKKALAELGFTNVAEFEDGMKAWQALEAALAEQKPFHFIFTDWTMPNMTGLELLQKIRGDARVAKLPVVFLTAEGDVTMQKQATEAGANWYITKPFSAERIKIGLSAVYSLVNKAAA